ncbi:HAD hydrolase-like protein, partial [Pseudomonas sp. 2822-17]|uniref:HAD hydrolase-like protein n=1 Tax=Pseudomonas sp. 2822-17 TaxID=1712678 RepID=UPI001C48EEA0
MARFIELDQRGYVWKDKVYQQLVEELQITQLTWEDLLEDYLREFKNHCVPFDQLIVMLEKLKQRNLKLGMITNGFG